MSIRHVRRSALSAVLLAGVLSAVTAVTAHAQKTATFLDYTTQIPTTWTSRPPASSMRLAEYTTPAPAGTGGAEVIVYFFGKGQGGSPDANLARWKGQFSNPGGGPVQEKVSKDTAGDIPLTIAEYRGTYARAVGMGSAPEDARPNHMLIAVVAESPRGTIFFQCFGPTAAVESQRAAYLQFVKRLK
jgi:hypothetical protein